MVKREDSSVSKCNAALPRHKATISDHTTYSQTNLPLRCLSASHRLWCLSASQWGYTCSETQQGSQLGRTCQPHCGEPHKSVCGIRNLLKPLRIQWSTACSVLSSATLTVFTHHLATQPITSSSICNGKATLTLYGRAPIGIGPGKDLGQLAIKLTTPFVASRCGIGGSSW